MDIAEFKEIPEYPKYLINIHGQVFSTKSNKILTPIDRSGNGYLSIKLWENNKTVNLLLHRVLARVFLNLPSLDSELEVDHIDTNPLNNSLDNLQVLDKNSHKIKTCEDRGHTIGGSNNNKNKCTCGELKSQKSFMCKKCYLNLVRKTGITKEEIENQVRLGGWVNAAKAFGLSDNGLRKRYRSLGGDPKECRKQTTSK